MNDPHIGSSLDELLEEDDLLSTVNEIASEIIQTKQSVIARLEDADYEGHSLSMLQRIADALEQKIEIVMIPNSSSR